MTEPRVYNVLFLCTGNSARSIIAEALLTQRGAGRFRAFSAGSHPTGRVNPMALAVLESLHLPTGQARSKGWEEFSEPDSPAMDFIVTVCDNAAGEVCPIWPGHPMTAHWGVPDPAGVEGSEDERREAFQQALRALDQRITQFTNLGMEAVDPQDGPDRPDLLALQQRLREIGTPTR